MSAGVLKYTVVRVNPETMTATAILAGSEVPEWASDMVHADDLESGASTSKTETPDPPPAAKYEDLKVPELVALINERNEGREDDEKISNDGKKAELVSALLADDEKN